jgi:hypothetical protein
MKRRPVLRAILECIGAWVAALCVVGLMAAAQLL